MPPPPKPKLSLLFWHHCTAWDVPGQLHVPHNHNDSDDSNFNHHHPHPHHHHHDHHHQVAWVFLASFSLYMFLALIPAMHRLINHDVNQFCWVGLVGLYLPISHIFWLYLAIYGYFCLFLPITGYFDFLFFFWSHVPCVDPTHTQHLPPAPTCYQRHHLRPSLRKVPGIFL